MSANVISMTVLLSVIPTHCWSVAVSATECAVGLHNPRRCRRLYRRRSL